jgi:GTPase
VVDAASPQAPDHARHVLQVLREIDAHATPQILVLNKMDLIEADADASLIAQRIIGTSLPEGTVPNAVAVSARTGAGVPQLVERIDQLLRLDPLATIRLKIPHLDGATIHLVHERTRVLEKIENETEVDFLVEAPESVRKFLARFAQS